MNATTWKLDTSGEVRGRNDGRLMRAAAKVMEDSAVRWSDINPFTQGYVDALFVTFRQGDIGHWPDTPHAQRVMRFDRLAPETLARIMEYCSAVEAPLPPRHRTPVQGRDCWRARQAGLMTAPPLTPYLGDDGKVYLRDQA